MTEMSLIVVKQMAVLHQTVSAVQSLLLERTRDQR